MCNQLTLTETSLYNHTEVRSRFTLVSALSILSKELMCFGHYAKPHYTTKCFIVTDAAQTQHGSASYLKHHVGFVYAVKVSPPLLVLSRNDLVFFPLPLDSILLAIKLLGTRKHRLW